MSGRRVDIYNAQAIEQCKKHHPGSSCSVLTYPSCERTGYVFQCHPIRRFMENVKTPHVYGDLYPGESHNVTRRYILTTLHKDCGGQILTPLSIRGYALSWKTERLKQDGTPGCLVCLKQPLGASETYQDYC